MSPKKIELEHKPKSAWEVYSSKKHRSAMNSLAKRYLDFLTRCKTERETVDFVRDKAEDAGFVPDFHSKACFRILHNKTIFLARKGKKPLSEGFRFVGAHADTPRLDLKQHPVYEDCRLSLAKTHYYGGIRKHQWLARPLALHGVVAKTDGTMVDVVIGEDPSDPVLTIDDLLPHLAQKQAVKKLADAFEAEKMNIILGHEPSRNADPKEKNSAVKQMILEILNERWGIVEEDLYSAELQIVPAGPARPVGLDSALIGGYGQDDRSCVYTALEALLAEKTPEHCQIVLFYDKEEIGSEGSTSAKSLFFEFCLEDLIEAWEPESKLSRVLYKSKALSADVHAAVNPDYQDVHEKLNSAFMGMGPSLCKFTGHRGKIAANDAHAEYVGWLRGVLNEAGVPWQMAELGKVDQGGGGTVAKFLAAYCLDVIDFGPPVLSMHSPFEITGKADIYATVQAFRAFLRS